MEKNGLCNISEAMAWDEIGAISIKGVKVVGTCLELTMVDGGVLSVAFSGGGLRLKIGTGINWGIISGELQVVSGTLRLVEGGCIYESSSGVVEIGFSPFNFKYIVDGKIVQQSGVDGHFSRTFRVPPLSRVDGAWILSLNLVEGEGVYGLGEKWGALNHRGSLVRSWNEDALGVNAEISYKNIPFCFGTAGWGYFVHGGSPVTHAVGYGMWSHRCIVAAVESDVLDIFLFAGSGAEIINKYCRLTGFAQKPPLYSLGVIMSRAYYRTHEEIVKVAKEIREKKFPCDVITFDGRAWQDTRTRFLFEWDPARYPSPSTVVDELRALDFEVCNWEYPLVSIHNPRFAELESKGYFLKDGRTGKTYIHQWGDAPWGSVLTPLEPSALIDFTHPLAYEFWKMEHKHIFNAGVVMLKPDFGEQVHEDVIASNGMSGKELHNVYAFLYNRCCWEASKMFAGEKAFMFSRSGWSGSQRFPSLWGGDPQADFGGLAGSIRGSLSWGLSGGPFFATDIGGFYGDTRDSELYIRWCQMAVFSAHMRFHGIGEREPWSYGDEVFREIMSLVQLRYRLIPYLQQCIELSCDTGLPVQRAMVLAFPEDPLAWQFDTQFLFGPSLLVVPCIHKGGNVTFYLPKGNWSRFPTHEQFEGAKLYSMNLSVHEYLVFVKATATIPLGKDIEHVGEGITIVEHWQG